MCWKDTLIGFTRLQNGAELISKWSILLLCNEERERGRERERERERESKMFLTC